FHMMPGFAALVAGRGIDAADDRAEDVDSGAGAEDSGAGGEAAMAAEARRQLADLDALAPYAARLSRARRGLPADEREHLLASLRAIC
ncbi:MAG: hypothetical protein ACREFP_19165, partial [Acetobacteraceae bacterium]